MFEDIIEGYYFEDNYGGGYLLSGSETDGFGNGFNNDVEKRTELGEGCGSSLETAHWCYRYTF